MRMAFSKLPSFEPYVPFIKSCIWMEVMAWKPPSFFSLILKADFDGFHENWAHFKCVNHPLGVHRDTSIYTFKGGVCMKILCGCVELGEMTIWNHSQLRLVEIRFVHAKIFNTKINIHTLIQYSPTNFSFYSGTLLVILNYFLSAPRIGKFFQCCR